MKTVIRTLGFVNKELREVARQPMLVLTLIFGPFLILLLFGLGHDPVQPPLKAIMVIPSNVNLPIPEDQYQKLFGTAIQLVALSDDEVAARQQVVDRQVDLAVVVPADLYQRLTAGDQAAVSVLYDEIDPVMSNYIRFIASAQISEMNRGILEGALRQALAPQGARDEFTAATQEEVGALDRDVAAGDVPSAQRRIARLDGTAASALDRLDSIRGSIGVQADGQPGVLPAKLQVVRAAVLKFRADLASLSRDLDSQSPNVAADLAAVHADAVAMRQAAVELAQAPTQVIAAPLTSTAENLAPLQPGFVAFYAPAVLALLLQHVAVTFGSLSMVRERLYGAMELFRVAPVAPLQVLLGKCIAYLMLGALVTAALTYLIIYVLQVPFTGSYQLFVEVVAGLLLASLAIGFAISLISSSERQAVQLSMLVLIASVFFSGFFMRLESFAWPVRGVAYALPVTYGIQALQGVMLRGATSNDQSLAALGIITAVLLVAAVWLLRRELRRASDQHSRAE